MIHLALLDGHPRAEWLHRRNPPLRILSALLTALVTVSLHQLPTLLLITGLALAFALAVGLPLQALAKRLLALEGFMLVLVLFLPFTVPGNTLISLGPLDATVEGLERALEIVLKANCVVIVLMTLVGTMEPVILGHALARLRMPEKLVHLFLFTVRYINVLYDEYKRLRLAMRARAFVAGSNWHTWRCFGWLIGMLLIRSLERAQRIQNAMKCRGFNGRFYLLDKTSWTGGDTVTLLLILLLLGNILLLERQL
jgi:cobalt/nickel transport system permease protein